MVNINHIAQSLHIEISNQICGGLQTYWSKHIQKIYMHTTPPTIIWTY